MSIDWSKPLSTIANDSDPYGVLADLRRRRLLSGSGLVKIYLAGKIAQQCWRSTILHTAGRIGDFDNSDWRTQRFVFGDKYEYVGPFFTPCDHGCAHSNGEHGVLDTGDCSPVRGYPERPRTGFVFEEDVDGTERKLRASPDICSGENAGKSLERQKVLGRCLQAIKDAHLVFAWIEDMTAFGSLWEMGFAVGNGIPVVVGLQSSFDASDLWFAVYGCRLVVRAETAREAFIKAMSVEADETKSESPIEEKMRQALKKVLPNTVSVEQQKPLCGYRADFAVTFSGVKVVVECDGHDFHEKTKEQAARDKKRDRDFQLAGWKVLRFTGSEIHRDVEACARDVAQALEM